MATIIKMSKVSTTMMAPRFTGAELNVNWVQEDINPNSYGCTGCGLIWSRKWQAETCEQRRHVQQFDQKYGGYVENNIRKGFTAYTRSAIGRDKAIRKAVTRSL